MSPKKDSKKVQLNLGCGIHLVKDFINVDNSFTLKDLQKGVKTKKGMFGAAEIDKGATFVRADVCKLPFKDNSVDYIESISMVEHIPLAGIFTMFGEIKRVLKPGCKAVIMTIDFADVAKLYLEELDKKDFDANRFRDIAQIIYGNQVSEGEFHRTPYSQWTFARISSEVGFKEVKVTYYPRYCTEDPKVKTMKWRKDASFTSANIKGEFIK
jgi:ubiquinone/menaquinone biosynthesis C-methylase UbiE